MKISQHKKYRYTTYEEKQKIVKEYFEDNLTYRQIAQKYDLSFKSVGNICNLFDRFGLGGLKPKNRRKQVFSERAVNPLRRENIKLQKRNQELEMENTLLKKLDEFLKKING